MPALRVWRVGKEVDKEMSKLRLARDHNMHCKIIINIDLSSLYANLRPYRMAQ